jgi:hypothetical protein
MASSAIDNASPTRGRVGAMPFEHRRCLTVALRAVAGGTTAHAERGSE